jgi:hypothetical protein
MRKSKAFWIISRPHEKDYCLYTIEPTRSASIKTFEEDDIGSWKRWYGRGYRCVKARIWEEGAL